MASDNQVGQYYEISLEGLAADNDSHVTVSLDVGSGLQNLVVYHKDALLTTDTSADEYFTYSGSTLTLYVKSFSPFSVIYDAPTWQELADFSWYDADKSEFEINTAEQLAGVAYLVNVEKNNLSGKTITLGSDIDLAGHVWTPIGNLVSYPGISFQGTFDGDNHTISNMNVIDTTVNYAVAAFFGSTAGDAVIKDVTFENSNVTSSHYAAVVLAYEASNKHKTSIQNVTVDGATIVSSAELLDGGYDNGDKVGGIVGYATSTTVSGCKVKDATIKGYRDIGGIFGCGDGAWVGPTGTSGCEVSNVTLIIDNAHNYKNYSSLGEHNVNAFIGRLINEPVSDNNTSSNVKIIDPYTT